MIQEPNNSRPLYNSSQQKYRTYSTSKAPIHVVQRHDQPSRRHHTRTVQSASQTTVHYCRQTLGSITHRRPRKQSQHKQHQQNCTITDQQKQTQARIREEKNTSQEKERTVAQKSSHHITPGRASPFTFICIHKTQTRQSDRTTLHFAF